MGKYKIGDIAASLPVPKVPETESGKKLLSLFGEFRKKTNSSSTLKKGIQVKDTSKQNLPHFVDNESASKKSIAIRKKRKFSETTESVKCEETDTVQNKEKKIKNSSIKLVESFPRKKKNKKEHNSLKSNNHEYSQEHSSKNVAKKSQKFNSPVSNLNFHNEEKNISQESNSKTEFSSKKFKAKKMQNGPHSPSQFNEESQKFSKRSLSKTSNNYTVKNYNPNFGKKQNRSLLSNVTENQEKKVKDTSNQNLPHLVDNKSASKKKKRKFSEMTESSKCEETDIVKNEEKKIENSPIKFKPSFIENFPRKKKIKNEDNATKSSNDSFSYHEYSQEHSLKDFGKKSHIFYDSEESKMQNGPQSSDEESQKFDKRSLSKTPNNYTAKNSNPDFSRKKNRSLASNVTDSPEKKKRTIFVGNLPKDTERKALQKHFSTIGPIESVRLRGIVSKKESISKKVTSITKNYHERLSSIIGYIAFKDKTSAENAVKLNGSLFGEHHIIVDLADKSNDNFLYDNKRSIFIGNLPFDVEDETIWNAFLDCGEVDRVRVIRDNNSGLGKGFGYVSFVNVESKESALALKNFEIGGRIVRIKSVKSKGEAFRKQPLTQESTSKQRINTYQKNAQKIKKKMKDQTKRKTTKKIMKRQKELCKKKKISRILQK